MLYKDEGTKVCKHEEVLQLTNQLITYVNDLERVFHDSSLEPSHTKQYFTFVKKETEQLFSILKKWEQIVDELITAGYLTFPVSMLQATKQNITALIMNSYYKDVRRRKYKEINRSVIYALHSLVREINDE